MIQHTKTLSPVVESATTAHSDALALVEATTFGSKALMYKRLGVQSQLDRFNAPRFFHAIADEELLGVYILDKRHLLSGDQHLNGYYRGVLAVSAQHQGCGIGKALTREARHWMTSQTVNSPALSYGCIDQGNSRSLKLLESGGATVGPALSMYMMYRQWPDVCCDLMSLENKHQEQVGAMADEIYGQCHVRDISPSTSPGYVLEDEAGVVISARVANSSFRITNMSAMATWFTRLFVNPLAFTRRRFNPECFRYVSFSEVIIRSGCESRWEDFVRTALALNDCHFGMVYVDPGSELFKRLQKSKPSNRLLHSATGSIHVVWQTFGQTGSGGLDSQGISSPLHLWPVDA